MSKKTQELLDDVAVFELFKFSGRATNGKRKKEKTSLEDAQQKPKKKRVTTEEVKENVDDSPRPKKKSSKPARKAPKTQALSLDDFNLKPVHLMVQQVNALADAAIATDKNRSEESYIDSEDSRLIRIPFLRVARVPKQTPPHDVVPPNYSLFLLGFFAHCTAEQITEPVFCFH
ncbi:hypothetical protein C8F01DRAFT_1079483 [Mycena amicta]|nr:hypothetical protein C8F01DRAFT_1079483 [Mycena amicta]